MAVTVREREFQIIISIFIICLYRIKCAFASLYFIAILCACACACATHLRFCHSSSLNPSYSLTLSTWESLNTTGINKNRKFERKDLSRKLFQLFSLFSIFRAFGLHIPHLPFPLFRRSQSAHTHTHNRQKLITNSAHTIQTHTIFTHLLSDPCKWHGRQLGSEILRLQALRLLLVRWCSVFHVDYIPFW